MTELGQALRQHSYRIAAIAPAAIGMAVIPYFALRFSTEEFGVFAVCESVVPILIAIFSLGVPQALLTFKPNQTKESYERFLSQAVLLGLILGCSIVLVSPLYWLFGMPVAAANGLRPLLGVAVLAVAAVEVPLYFMQSAYRASDQPLRYMTLAALHPLASVILGVVVAEIKGPYAECFLWSRAGSAAALVAISLQRFRVAAFGPKIYSAIRVGLPLMPANLISLFQPAIPRFALMALSGPESLGLFTFAWKAAAAANLLVVQPAVLMWHTVLFRKDAGESPDKKLEAYLRSFLNQATIFMLSVFILAMCGIFMSSRSSLVEAFTKKFDLALIFCISLSWIIGGISQILNVGPYVMQRTSSVLRCYVIAGVAFLFASCVLVHYYQALGAAFALLVYQFALAGLLWRNSQGILPLSVSMRRTHAFLAMQLALLVVLVIQ